MALAGMGAGAWAVFDPLQTPKNLLAAMHIVSQLPEPTPERWKIVRDFVTHHLGDGTQLADDVQWVNMVVRGPVRVTAAHCFFVGIVEPIGRRLPLLTGVPVIVAACCLARIGPCGNC
jgi:hypothetical protein